MGRKFFVGGNWKMNGNKQAIDGIIAFLKAGPLDPNVGLSNMFLVTHAWCVLNLELCNSRCGGRLPNHLLGVRQEPGARKYSGGSSERLQSA
jgi:hypothetical protein